MYAYFKCEMNIKLFKWCRLYKNCCCY